MSLIGKNSCRPPERVVDVDQSPFQCISPWEGCRGGNGRGTRGGVTLSLGGKGHAFTCGQGALLGGHGERSGGLFALLDLSPEFSIRLIILFAALPMV
jgi:hypothetical protein